MHLIEWEASHGPIPKWHCLKAVDGDRNNLAADNWVLIERALLPALNGGPHRRRPTYDAAPAELKPTLLALAQVETKARGLRNRNQPTP